MSVGAGSAPWACAVIKRVANGWMVTREAANASSWVESVFVFNSWVECAEFVRNVTDPAPAEVPVLTEAVKS